MTVKDSTPKPELLPCPFGGDKHSQSTNDMSGLFPPTFNFMSCSKCGAQGPALDWWAEDDKSLGAQEAIQLWNRRA